MPHGSAFAFGCGLLVFGGAGLGGGPDFLGGNSGVDSLKFDLELNGSLKSWRIGRRVQMNRLDENFLSSKRKFEKIQNEFAPG